MNLNFRCTLQRDLAIHAIRQESNFLILLALQNFLMHIFVAPRIPALPAARIRNNFAASLPRSRIKLNRALRARKRPMHRVKSSAQCPIDFRLRRIKLK